MGYFFFFFFFFLRKTTHNLQKLVTFECYVNDLNPLEDTHLGDVGQNYLNAFFEKDTSLKHTHLGEWESRFNITQLTTYKSR